MENYLELLRKIRDEGHDHPDRTKVGRRSIFSASLRFDLSTGEFPLVTTRKIFTKGFIHELLWFIRGETDISYLKEEGVNIWNMWAVEEGHVDACFERFVKPNLVRQMDNSKVLDLSERAKILEDHLKGFKSTTEPYLNKIGPMYGAVWRNAPGSMYTGLNTPPEYDDIPSDKLGYYKDEYLETYDKDSLLGADPKFREFALNKYIQTIDQLQYLILNLKRDPYSSRHIVTAIIPEYFSIPGYSPQENVLMRRGCLYPCHMIFQCFVTPPKEEGGKLRLSLKLFQRKHNCAFN